MSNEEWFRFFCLRKEPQTDWVKYFCVSPRRVRDAMWWRRAFLFFFFLPQHELVACNGSSAGAGENLTHVLHQTQAVLCVQPEAVWQLPLLNIGRALSHGFHSCWLVRHFWLKPKTLTDVGEEPSLMRWREGFFFSSPPPSYREADAGEPTRSPLTAVGSHSASMVLRRRSSRE